MAVYYEGGPAAVTEAVDAFMAAGPLGVLKAVAATGEIVEAVQKHFHVTVQPRLAVVRAACLLA